MERIAVDASTFLEKTDGSGSIFPPFSADCCVLVMTRKSHPTSLISWNVNGIRAALQKGFADFFRSSSADVICLQEVKALEEQVEDMSWAEGYQIAWNPAVKKGYSGTAILSQVKPLATVHGMGIEEHDQEGRVLTLEFHNFYVVTVYTPNSQHGLKRLDYRQQWDRDFLAFLKHLEKTKPVVVCGDLNVAHKEIDLANPKSNRKNPGFTDEERAGFDALVEHGFIDTFRHFNQEPHQYTWWSYRSGARARNVGWRIDYWLTSEVLRPKLKSSTILNQVMGSDHCPIQIELKR